MQDVITRLVDVPFARMFVLAGIIFLMIAVLGKVEGKIEPGQVGRIGAAVLGIALMLLGVALQYVEIRENAAQIQKETVQATAVELGSKLIGDAPTLKVVAATFGRNCNGKTGNATAALAASCDGKSNCDHAIEAMTLADAPANCELDFQAEWKCSNASITYSAILPFESGKPNRMHLSCAH